VVKILVNHQVAEQAVRLQAVRISLNHRVVEQSARFQAAGHPVLNRPAEPVLLMEAGEDNPL